MSQENVEIVRQAFEAEVGALEETAEKYWHPEIEYVEDPRWPGASRYEGREQVLRCFQSYMDALDPDGSGTATVERVFDAGERLVPLVRFEGRSISGVPHEHLWAYVVEMKKQRIAYVRAYYEPGEAIEAAGLRE
jgi:ketosteroid isomerase-like protein